MADKDPEAVRLGKKSWVKRPKKYRTKKYMSKIGKNGRAKQLNPKQA